MTGGVPGAATVFLLDHVAWAVLTVPCALRLPMRGENRPRHEAGAEKGFLCSSESKSEDRSLQPCKV